MTAWAAGKFAGDEVGMFVKKSGIADKVKHQELIIPGYAAAIAGEVEEVIARLDDYGRTQGSSAYSCI